MSKNYSILSSDNETLQITIYGEENLSPAACIIYVHGFKGFKDWGFVPYLGEFFSSKNFVFLTFNYSHNGIGSNPMEFTELKKFKENTFSREIVELDEIINACNSDLLKGITPQKIGLLGHSRGGAIALLSAYKNEKVDFLSTWSSVADFDRYSERQKEEWRKKGVFEVVNMRTKQVMQLGLGLLDDLERNKNDGLNIKQAVSQLKKPLLIVHGEQDLAVKVDEAKKLYEWSNRDLTSLHIIDNTGHTFNAVHPFAGTNVYLKSALEETSNFFNRNLE